jgi:hypothetical protein
MRTMSNAVQPITKMAIRSTGIFVFAGEVIRVHQVEHRLQSLQNRRYRH